MTLKYPHRATVFVFAVSLVTVGPAYAQRRDGSLLPQNQSGQVTAVGCLVRGDAVRGGKKKKVHVGAPRSRPVASVPEANCTVEPGADALTLDNPERANMTDAMLGHWVEIGGRLESETDKDPDNLRELDVLTAKLVPVVILRPAAQPAPAGPPRGPNRGRPRPRPHRHRCRRHQPQRLQRSCRRRRAPFRRWDWSGCFRWRWASLFGRSVSDTELGVAATREATEGTQLTLWRPSS